MVNLEPNKEIELLILRGKNIRQQAHHEIYTGLHTKETGVLGNLLIGELVPHGYKQIARDMSNIGQKNIKTEIGEKWRRTGNNFLLDCESLVKQMSLNTKNLTISGNSSKLIRKFNRVKKINNPIPFFDNILAVLQEYQNLDLIWNKDIEQEIVKRRNIKEIKFKEKENLKLNSKDIINNPSEKSPTFMS